MSKERSLSTFYIDCEDPVCQLTETGTMFTSTGSSSFYHGNDTIHTCTDLKRQHTITGSTVTEAGASNFYSKPSLSKLRLIPPAILETGVRNPPRKLAKVGTVKFPQMKEFAHFHYNKVTVGCIQTYIDTANQVAAGNLYEVIVISNGHQWVVHRSFKDFKLLDSQIHYCVFDRKYSNLQNLKDLSSEDIKNIPEVISRYLFRYSQLSCNSVNCGTVLNFFELNSNGEHLISSMNESAINIPAIAAALVTKPYTSQEADELTLKVGDLVSVIDMPPKSESHWWRGKKSLEVGFFPGGCVELIDRDRRKSTESVSKASTPLDSGLSRTEKLRAFLRSFFQRRPGRVQLKQSGIVQERIFGGDLGEYLVNYSLAVPEILMVCTEAIEQHGLIDGIYRLSGAATKVQKLREEFDVGQKTSVTDDDILDIHSVSSVLKTYFRELPNPLLTSQLYEPLVAATRLKDTREQIRVVKSCIEKLCPPHYRTAAYLFAHLSLVASYSKKTGMTTRNLAIVWSPNVMRYDESNGTLTGAGLLQSISLQAAVTDILITNYDLIFTQVEFDSSAIGKKPVVKPLDSRLVNLSTAKRKQARGTVTVPQGSANNPGVLIRSKSMSAESFFESQSSSVLHHLPAAIHRSSNVSTATSVYDSPSANDSTGDQSSAASSMLDLITSHNDTTCDLRSPSSVHIATPSVTVSTSFGSNTQASSTNSPSDIDIELSKHKYQSEEDLLLLSSCKSMDQSQTTSSGLKTGKPTPTPRPRYNLRKHDYVNAEILRQAYIADQMNTVTKKKSFKPIPSVRRRDLVQETDSSNYKPIDSTTSIAKTDVHYTEGVEFTDSRDYDSGIPKLVHHNLVVAQDMDCDYNEAEPVVVDSQLHRPLNLAFSNPTSEDDGVRIPSALLCRLSVESI